MKTGYRFFGLVHIVVKLGYVVCEADKSFLRFVIPHEVVGL